MFGRSEVTREHSIGPHPDFLHLAETAGEEYCPIVSLFMDIAGSTRLGLLYDLRQVRAIKSAFLQSAIAIVQSFDGHVHRLMGDAVLAFFGGKSGRTENAVIDALNAAAVLRWFAENVVPEKLKEAGVRKSIGVRVGLDYGPEEKVLWSSYGVGPTHEVTATSFHVDVAAKLQQAAGRNNVMLGQALREHIDFPEELLRSKTIRRGTEDVPAPYVTPNHEGADGRPVNYCQWLLDADEYLRCTPFALAFPGDSPIVVKASVHDAKDAPELYSLAPGGRAVPKDKWIKFRARLPYTPHGKPEVVFRVENHGREAQERDGDNRGNHETAVPVRGNPPHEVEHWEPTVYRGLHYLDVMVRRDGRVVRAGRAGVYIL
ncbi:nucleotide-binding domain-containing protein [Alienimonas chondri]|uniref:nucleotide-binding domain-containing protein n=1 Tax=Alienimonas chondri TaxID=2681879 RepID=UPI00148798D0|nr:adenylate/guanylate cyclase domain-containing protein [Alienimonas chondri]